MQGEAQMSSGNSLGGGMSRGNVKNKKTYIGEDAGRQPGILDQLLAMYAGGGQQANAQNDLLFGGKDYGSAGTYFNPKPNFGLQPGGGGPSAGAQSESGIDAAEAPPFEDPGPGESQWNDQNDPDGTNRQREYVRNNPQYDPNKSGQATPTGGLVGGYQGMQDNPWQQGPNGDAETDVLGSYDWMASGNRNADESNVYGDLGKVGGQWDKFGQKTGIDAQREGGYTDLSGADPNELEGGAGDIYGSLGEANPNGLEQEQMGGARSLGQRGEDVGTSSDTYRGMVEHGGYDDATKAALTRESLAATRNPFEAARDRIVRGAAARGNVGSTAGSEIQLANQEAGALGDAAAKNQIAQAQEAIRQKEAGAQGLMSTQGITNAAKQASVTDLGNINQGMVNRRATAAAGEAGLSRDITGRRMGALSGLGDTQAAQDARKKAGLEGSQSTLAQKAAENTKQRNLALEGTKGKEGMFNTMFGRKQAGLAGTQHLYDVGQQQRAGDLAGLGNVGGKTAEDYVESGTGGGGL